MPKNKKQKNNQNQKTNHFQPKYKTLQSQTRNIPSQLQPIKINEKQLRQNFQQLIDLVQWRFQGATKIEFLKSKTTPSIWVKYKYKGSVHQSHIRDLIFKDKPLMKRPKIIDQIYERIYSRVSYQYRRILQYAYYKAQDKKIYTLNDDSVWKMYEKNQQKFMFYFCPNSKKISFSLFDEYYQNVEFDSDFIQYESKYQSTDKNYKKYKKFISSIPSPPPPPTQSKRQENQPANDFFLAQLDSDQERQTRNKAKNTYYLNKLKDRIYAIFDKQLQPFDDQIQDLKQKQSTMRKKYRIGQNSQFRNQLQEIRNEIKQKAKRIRDFQQKISDLQNELNKKLKKSTSLNQDVRMHENYLKKALLVQKQLQSKLPIYLKKERILQLIHKNNLILLEGETGSGKSTQLPQILCQYYQMFDNDVKPILMTQPRKISIRTLAERVAFELGDQIGQFVDYQTSQSRSYNQQAKIIFKLDRLVLDELCKDKTLSKYSCLVIDEAHERSINIDVIIGLINNLLRMRKDFKIIVTSASMNIELFERYFTSHKIGNFKSQKISGQLFQVTNIYKEYPSRFTTVQKILDVLDRQILISNDRMNEKYKGHVLVFCSSVDQINKLVEIYQAKLKKSYFKVYALHGRIQPSKQKLVFQTITQIKLIFASRIAETSITIDGVTVVIDPGYDREMIYDQNSKISSMELRKISQSSAKQRAGRAGRTKNGFCFRLYSQKSHRELTVNKISEIQNTALQIVVLRLKSLNIQDTTNFAYIQTPSRMALQSSERTLKLLGALNGNGQINTIGRLLLKIPIQPFLSRSIAQSLIYQHILKSERENAFPFNKRPKEKQKILKHEITKSVLQILCMVVNSANLFPSYQDQNHSKAQKIKFQQFSNQKGDFFYLRNIYDQFVKLQQKVNVNENKLRSYLKEYYLNYKVLKQAVNLKKQIEIILKYNILNFKTFDDEIIQGCKAKLKVCQSYEQIVMSCLMASFCSNLCLYTQHPDLGYTLLHSRAPIQIYGTSSLSLAGINPKWIVCYDLYKNERGKLYCKIAQAIDQNLFEKFVDQHIQKQFNLKQLRKFNPFVRKVTDKFPTLTIQQIERSYYNRFALQDLSFMKQIQLVSNRYSSEVVFFIVGDAEQGSRLIQDELKRYIQKLKKRYVINYINHNYRHNSQIVFGNGLQIMNIKFQSQKNICVLKYSNYYYHYELIRYLSQCGQFYFADSQQLKIQLNDEIDKKQFENNISPYLIQNGISIYWEKVTYLKNSCQANLQFKFFRCSSQKSEAKKVYLSGYQYYDSADQSKSILSKAISRFNQQDKLFNNKQIGGLQCSQVLQSRDCFGCYSFQLNMPQKVYFDEIDIFNLLHIFYRKDYLSYDFTFPQYIFKKRQIANKQLNYSETKWRDLFNKLMKSMQIQGSQYAISVYPDSNFSSIVIIDFKTYNHLICKQIVQKMDKQQDILGVQKVHITSKYQFKMPAISKKVYDFCVKQFDNLISQIKQQKSCTIQTYTQEFDYSQLKFIEITLWSDCVESLFEIIKQVKMLFTPKYVMLQQIQFNYFRLQIKDNHDEMIRKLSRALQQQVYIELSILSKQLKVYCEKTKIQQIKHQLKKLISTNFSITQKISYKGKNLIQIKKILDKIQNKSQSRKELDYQIDFAKKQVTLTTNTQNIIIIKDIISKLQIQNLSRCTICSAESKGQLTYFLYNCDHAFCWECLIHYIKDYHHDQKEIIDCPNQKQCKKDINIYDIKRILNEQFEKVADDKMQWYLKNNKRYTSCQTCEQIYDLKSIKKKQIICNICGSVYKLQY